MLSLAYVKFIVLCLPDGVEQELQQKKAQRAAEKQRGAEVENLRQTCAVGRKKPSKISPVNKSPASPSNNSPMSPTDVKAKNTGLLVLLSYDTGCMCYNFITKGCDTDVISDSNWMFMSLHRLQFEYCGRCRWAELQSNFSSFVQS